MNSTGPSPESREIARVLVGALTPVIAPASAGAHLTVAREVAQMLELEGLDRVLAALEPHAGAAWPASFTGVIQRLARLCEAAEAAGSIAPFERADLELVGLAAELGGIEWSPAGEPDALAPAVPTLSVRDVLDDERLPADDARALARVRLSAPVAAALRAALDWLSAEAARRTSRAHAEDSMLEVWVQGIDPLGLRAASEVLAAVDGNLGPVGPSAPPGTWRLRVPAHSTRASYLMVVQGGVSLALPWHSVVHVHLMPADQVADAQPPAAELAPLVPLAPLSEPDDERPVVMLGHGLRRAWMVADRLVWRFPAERCAAADPAPAPALDGMVRTEEGESWWRVDVARLLAGVDPLPVPDAPASPLPDTRALAAAAERALEIARAERARPELTLASAVPLDAPAPEAPETAVPPAREPHERALEVAPPAAAPAAPEAERPLPLPEVEAPRRAAWSRWSPQTPPAPQELPPPRVEILRPQPLPPPTRTVIAPAAVAPPAIAAADVTPVAEEAVIEAPAVEESAIEPPPPAPLALGSAEVEALPMPVVAAPVEAPAEPPAPAESEVAEPEVAEPEVVEPLAVTPAPEPTPEPPLLRETSAPAVRPRRALIAEDSMMARLFLMRMLQQRGFVVDAVDSATALVPVLGRGPWGLVCLDVELPDARGTELVAGVRERLARMQSPAALVALVRDAEDAAAAHQGDVTLTLRKPFDARELEAMLARIGLGGEG